MQRGPLQIATAVLACVPTLTGLLALTGLDDPLYRTLALPRDATLDSNLRFYGGVWLGLGLAAFWLLPRIERETVLFRCLWLMIFLGAPLFVWWQSRVARSAAAPVLWRRAA